MLTLTRKSGEAVFIGDTIKITIVEKQGDNVVLSVEAMTPQPPIEPKVPLSWSLKVLFDKVNIFVARACGGRGGSMYPTTVQIACQDAIRNYPGGPKAFMKTFGLPASFEDRLFNGEPQEISVLEFSVILKATRAQCIVDALGDLLEHNIVKLRDYKN